MPNWLQSARAYLVLTGYALAVAALVAAVLLVFGLGWGFLFAFVVAALLTWIGAKLDFAGAFVILPGWAGALLGLVVGLAWRILL